LAILANTNMNTNTYTNANIDNIDMAGSGVGDARPFLRPWSVAMSQLYGPSRLEGDPVKVSIHKSDRWPALLLLLHVCDCDYSRNFMSCNRGAFPHRGEGGAGREPRWSGSSRRFLCSGASASTGESLLLRNINSTDWKAACVQQKHATLPG